MLRLIAVLTLMAVSMPTADAQIFKKWRRVCTPQGCYQQPMAQRVIYTAPPVVTQTVLTAAPTTITVRSKVGWPSVVAKANTCVDERNAWQAADDQLAGSVVARNEAKAEVEAATTAEAEALAAYEAAVTAKKLAVEAYEVADGKVDADAAVAGEAYLAFINCVKGSEE